jgi:4,5-DOPA dioxygenase extradiol
MKNDLVIRDAGENAKQLILLLHGMGSSPKSMESLGLRLTNRYSAATVVALCAPIKPLSNGGFEWFSVNGITEDNRIERVTKAMPSFVEAIQFWQNFSGVTRENTVLVGFSQGSIMALESTKYLSLVGRIVAVAGRFASLHDIQATTTAIHLVHGQQDVVFQHRHSVVGAQHLRAKGVNVSVDVLPLMGHEISIEGMERIMKFLMEDGPLQRSQSVSRMPSVFLSHGAPTYALEPSIAGPQLAALGASLEPKAVLIMSPHWMTEELAVSTVAEPKTIHDFGGFPEPLYRLQYPAKGSTEYATKALSLFHAAGIPAVASEAWGLDHGAWVPMMHMFSDAQYPVFQVSMPSRLNFESAYALGRILKPLREEGVLIIGSGSLTHNLYEIERDSPYAASYVKKFQAWIRDKVVGADLSALLQADARAPDFARAHPTNEHFLPLLFSAGAAEIDEKVSVLEGGIEHHVLSMESYVFGMALPLNYVSLNRAV